MVMNETEKKKLIKAELDKLQTTDLNVTNFYYKNDVVDLPVHYIRDIEIKCLVEMKYKYRVRHYFKNDYQDKFSTKKLLKWLEQFEEKNYTTRLTYEYKTDWECSGCESKSNEPVPLIELCYKEEYDQEKTGELVKHYYDLVVKEFKKDYMAHTKILDKPKRLT